eukprot:jgi/Psemu1/35450/gm1.35450_g
MALQNRPKAKVAAPTEELLNEYISAIVWGAADRLKLRIQQSGDWLEQNQFYKGWASDTFVNSVFVFAPDGKICIATFNCPGNWHDSTISDYGIYEKMEDMFIKYSCGERIPHPELPTYADNAATLLLNHEATSLPQLSEWGMQMIQGQKVIVHLAILLYNYQTCMIGHNQILNVFMHKKDGYFSYANKPTEDATDMFE